MVANPTTAKVGKGSSRLADMVQMANGLNSRRALASILVVLIHSAVPYMVSPIPVLWVVHDTSQSLLADALVIGVNGFVMPLFFLLAGMSIAKSSLLRPFGEFAWHRIRRLGSTFLLAAFLILPLLLCCWAIGLLWTERLTMGHFVRMRFPKEWHAYLGPAHLWFLEYLLLLSIGWSAVARFSQQWNWTKDLIQGKWMHAVLGSVWGPFVLAVPTAIVFAVDANTPFRLITPFTPDVARLVHYSVFMIAGVWLAGFPQAFSRLRKCSVAPAGGSRGLYRGLPVKCGLLRTKSWRSRPGCAGGIAGDFFVVHGVWIFGRHDAVVLRSARVDSLCQRVFVLVVSRPLPRRLCDAVGRVALANPCAG